MLFQLVVRCLQGVKDKERGEQGILNLKTKMIMDKTESEFAKLVEFISQQVGSHDVSISRSTLIEDDLGVTGEDAMDLLRAFSEKYTVDISNFIFEKYFFDEPGIFNLQIREIEPFTIGHLEKAIIAGRLDEEVINR